MTLILWHLVADRKKEILSNLDPHINIPNYVIFAKEVKLRSQNRQSNKKRNTNTANQSKIGL